jgi:hypothetical protein
MRDYRTPNGAAGSAGVEQANGAKPGGKTRTQDVNVVPHEIPFRAQMESAFGEDFSSVEVEVGQHSAMEGIGAKAAAAKGDKVTFADANPTPWLVAHELTHVVQQRRGAGAKKATIAGVDNSAEHEANRVADKVAGGQSAGDITAQPAGEVQRFAPGGHRASTVEGLKDTFSAEEIGDIYASNWERDFSQGNSDIANVALAWTAVKNHATKNKGDPGPAGATFQAAAWKVVNGKITDAMAESLGGYKYWEHMDHPTGGGGLFGDSIDKQADKRWAKHSNGLAGYLNDSKAHIKDQMVAAVDVYRDLHNLGGVGGKIDNWQGVAKPEGYTTPTVTDGPKSVATTLPKNFDDKTVASRDPVKEQTFGDAKAAGAKSDPAYNSAQWQLVAQHLGRAMHAFQDFWSHSNWLEMAKLAKVRAAGGGKVEGGEAANKGLKTGTFEMASKSQALGEKLLMIASGLQRDFPLLLRVYGRTAASTKIDSPDAKKNRSTVWGGQSVIANTDNELAYNALKTDSYTTLGEISDVGDAVNNVEELVLSGKYKMEDFLCNQTWLEALANKGRLLVKQGEDNADEDAHAKLAKDQDEGDESKDYNAAMALSKAADAMVFGPLRAIMDEKNADSALAATQKQLDLVDTMLQAPTPSHPLWNLVK